MLDFLYTAVSWVLLRWHDLFVLLGFDEASGLGWVLSIVFLVITARLLLFRLFVKQIHYQRNMQKMQPKLAKIREKYKHDRAEMNRQMMKFQQEEGFNPLSGCLPMLLQIPVFIGLYHTLRHLANTQIADGYKGLCPGGKPGSSDLLSLYSFTPQQTCDGAKADLFGAPLAGAFRDSDKVITALLGGGDGSATTTKFIILPLLLISAGATLATQLLARANATTTPEGTAATVQRLMLWIIPLGVLASGLLFNFPLGVLLYWFVSNTWTLAQQAYIIRFHPPEQDAPAAPAGQLGKTLAPKVGQRPQRPAKAGTKTVDLGKADDADAADEDTGSTAARGGSAATRSSTPRPGQKPARSGSGKRPPSKRPTQAKKRR
ncbi:membrane protein insertase YidC [Jatrophihabitans fulvus]